MQYQGKIVTWKADRGFGFIEWDGGNENVFAHISAFVGRKRRPIVGDIVIYQTTQDKNGRTRAKNITFLSEKPETTDNRRQVHKASAGSERSELLNRAIATIVALLVIGFGVYFLYASTEPQPLKSNPAKRPVIRIDPYKDEYKPSFSCRGKTHCSHMSSCEEAKFYIKNCPNTAMDGDRDGVPCERQWCGR